MGLKVLVTGASSGIGRATAIRFSKAGHNVFATARSESKLKETANLAEGLGGPTIHTGIGDVGSEKDVARNFEEAKKALGDRFDVVILNAGISWPPTSLEDYTVESYNKIMDTNVRGVFLWLKFVLPILKKQGSGQIVIINSLGGLSVPMSGFTLYAASKFALTGMAEGLRMEVHGTGIKVASVHPAAVDTPIWGGPEWEKAGITPEQLGLDREVAMTPDDIADVIDSIVYQSPRSDIDKVVLFPNHGLKKQTK